MTLEFRDLTKRYGAVTAINQVSMTFEAGKIHAIIGPNGAGKSTLVNLATGSYELTSGEIFLDGQPIHQLQKYQISLAGIARTFQNIRLFDRMQVIENIEVCLFPSEARHVWRDLVWPADARRRREERLAYCMELLEQFGLQHVAFDEAASLSYGRQRMLEIVRALARRPRVLLLDEPAAGLNEAESAELRDRLKALRRPDLSVIVIEHDMDLVMSISDHVYVLQNGALLFDGTPDEVQASQDVQHAYLGTENELESIRQLAQRRKSVRRLRH
ncbi:ABC transporter ATP-binding protein [Paraburkholderia bonniea]|uniref:ABC transporter ATP-binding protein n=1 Tax=Paraburkholderia bonniea TaxID=2152891 RepID=UPI001290B264|nr:ABC transporter ATP-binding protein [Paraburkholderia bonniea]WJF89636.1 ABC transporter ATP-binding protein [Paraburkholderia bonniea]WJF92950.1 ABC transporter ATP-binding protein [Paraburkholderia bonniea]